MESPLKNNDDKNNLDEKIKQFNNNGKAEEIQLNELLYLIDKEYDIIFGNEKNQKMLKKLFDDFPYEINYFKEKIL